ncbi:MAG TPA: YCF48-related protein [Saprospiraceae bacterium]|nr:YCF48-related protein [Saprospiraceae bacterium]
MKKILLTYFLFLIAICQSFSQEWSNAGPIPFANRYDDIYFVNPQTGWTVNSEGNIYKTVDGGESWVFVYQNSYYFRSIEFLDAMTGFAGTLNGVLLRTTDGGSTWEHIESLIPTPIQGVCGLSHAGDNVYGVGIWSYPAYFIKSTDRGDSWTYTDMSGYANGLVDCHFIDENIGFVCGINENIGAVILKTIDGGGTWQLVFSSNDGMEYIWKMDFVNEDVAYGAIESFANSTSVVKTLDGGDTWGEYPVTSIALDIQGIGFANELKGWVGPRNSPMWETNDGGLSWGPLSDFPNVNRIFRLDEDHLFASANVIFKYDVTITATEDNVVKYAHEILDVTPNPFSSGMEIKVRIDKSTYAKLDILSIDGKLVSSLADEMMDPGIHNFILSEKTLSSLKSGTYILLFRTNEGFLTKQIVKVAER